MLFLIVTPSLYAPHVGEVFRMTAPACRAPLKPVESEQHRYAALAIGGNVVLVMPFCSDEAALDVADPADGPEPRGEGEDDGQAGENCVQDEPPDEK